MGNEASGEDCLFFSGTVTGGGSVGNDELERVCLDNAWQVFLCCLYVLLQLNVVPH